jgi:hypothetical protein
VNTDPSENVVGFYLDGPKPYVASAPTRAENGIEQAWLALPIDHQAVAGRVSHIHSEWEPSAADAEFIRRTFPAAAVTFSFPRPGPDGWDAAFAEAHRVISQAIANREAARAKEVMEHASNTGELLPVLWSQSSPRVGMLEVLPHRAVVPGRLYVTVAKVGPTPHGTIGMFHLGPGELGDRPFEEVLAEGSRNLARSLRVEGGIPPGGDPSRPDLLVVEREGTHAASVVALPDFLQRLAEILGDPRLLVAVPDPDIALVTRQDSELVEDLRQAVLTSECPSTELVPILLAVDPTGIRVLAERPA